MPTRIETLIVDKTWFSSGCDIHNHKGFNYANPENVKYNWLYTMNILIPKGYEHTFDIIVHILKIYLYRNTTHDGGGTIKFKYIKVIVPYDDSMKIYQRILGFPICSWEPECDCNGEIEFDYWEDIARN